jgi:hypothetical protein
VGGGSFELSCGGCALGKLGSGNAELMLGYHFSERLRLELGALYQSNRDSSVGMFAYSAGLGYYPLGNLHVRAGVAFLKGNGTDVGHDYATAKGTGFIVGAAYDLHLWTLWNRTISLTPFVNYMSANLTGITVTGSPNTISGKGTSLTFGVALSGTASRFECTTVGGTPIRLDRQNEYAFNSCVESVRQRLLGAASK